MHRAPCVQDALRLRQRIHHSIAQGSFQRAAVDHPYRGTYVSGSGAVSIDLCQQVMLHHYGGQTQFILVDLRSGRVSQRWPMPRLLYCAGHDLQNAHWIGNALAIPHCASSNFQPCQDAGVLLVDAQTGAWTHARLTAPEEHVDNVEPCLSALSPAGCMLVHRLQILPAASCTIDVLSAQGTVLQTATFPADTTWLRPECWGPDNQAALVQRPSTLWIWRPCSDRQPVCTQLVGELINSPFPQPSCCAWSLDSHQLLLVYESGHVLLWEGEASQPLFRVPGAVYSAYAMMWGSHNRVAVLSKSTRALDTISWQVSFHRVSGNCELQLVHSEVLSEHLVQSVSSLAGHAVSPDGTHVCLAMCLPPGKQTLRIMTMDGQVLQNLEVPFLAYRAAWAEDCSKLLLSDPPNLRTFLLDFV